MQDTLHTAAHLSGHLPGLLLRAEQVAHTFMKGVHGRRRVGQGETFWQFRHYAPGDSMRDIDWKQTAKRDDPYVRELEWEAAQTLWLWRDASESMNFSSAKKIPPKKECAEVLLLALSMLALNAGEQVGLIGTNLAPQAHYNSARRIFDYLPQQDRLLETGRTVSSKSHALLFSDFYFAPENLSAFCGGLARRGVKGGLIQLVDPAEQNLPWSGRVKFQDIEDPGHSLTLPQVEDIRAAYAEKFRAHQEAVRAVARANGWTFLSFSTDTPYEKILTGLYDALAE
jgi:uncharacterized protein (DUF58 family)